LYFPPGPFYFTKLLMPLLISTADGGTRGAVRIINMSSAGHHLVKRKPMDYSILKPPAGKKPEAPEYLYSLSKFVGRIVPRSKDLC
jgi:retinol dehydrogenase 12